VTAPAVTASTAAVGATSGEATQATA
jgi:hypothetical protein